MHARSARRPCRSALPHSIVGDRSSAWLLIISQVPAGETRLSFNDRGGDRLRACLAIDRKTFCDEA